MEPFHDFNLLIEEVVSFLRWLIFAMTESLELLLDVIEREHVGVK